MTPALALAADPPKASDSTAAAPAKSKHMKADDTAKTDKTSTATDQSAKPADDSAAPASSTEPTDASKDKADDTSAKPADAPK
jgi:hypothetical protein